MIADDWSMMGALEQAVRRRSWGPQEELLASIFDAVAALHTSFLLANTPEKHRYMIPPASRYPRPEPEVKPRRSWLDVLSIGKRR